MSSRALRRASLATLVALACTLAVPAPARLAAQVVVPMGGPPPRPAGPDSATLQSQAVRVFLDCQQVFRGCDRDFFVTEVNFVNWVRDRFDAEVQLLVTSLSNGGGGTEYTMTFIGRKRFEGMVDTLVHNSRPNDPDDRIRRDLARTVKLGLARYAARSGIAPRLQLAYVSPSGVQQADPKSLKDPWDFWLFSASLNGFGNAETQQRFVNGFASFSANRATESLKMNFGISGSVNESRFTPTGLPKIEVIRRSYATNALIVKSLTSHLSAGIKAGASFSDFFNQDLAIRLQPAIEYNLFPWSEQTRRQLTLLYNVGPNYYDYQRTTVLGRDTELRWSQQATASFIARQSWGSSNVSLDWINYLHDFSRHALTLSGNIDLRIGRGLSLNFGGSAARIRDQIYLPRAGNTEEEILLQRQALQTGFRLFGSVGVRYTFGSIYNTIVNQRFNSLGSSGGRFFFSF
jgi:hypothetical protein